MFYPPALLRSCLAFHVSEFHMWKGWKKRKEKEKLHQVENK